MQIINKRARFTLYLLLGVELMLVSVYYAWGRPQSASAHQGSTEPRHAQLGHGM